MPGDTTRRFKLVIAFRDRFMSGAARMQSLSEHLLKAGLVTEEQAARVDAAQQKKGNANANGNANGAPKKRDAKEARPEGSGEARPPKAKKEPGVPRVVELGDPNKLKVMQAVEKHRYRKDYRGPEQFHFAMRDGKVRKFFVSDEVYEGLEAGKLAIVENGAVDQHVIVSAEAVALIRGADPEAVRFHNAN